MWKKLKQHKDTDRDKDCRKIVVKAKEEKIKKGGEEERMSASDREKKQTKRMVFSERRHAKLNNYFIQIAAQSIFCQHSLQGQEVLTNPSPNIP